VRRKKEEGRREKGEGKREKCKGRSVKGEGRREKAALEIFVSRTLLATLKFTTIFSFP
jgi:hypothetical protein